MISPRVKFHILGTSHHISPLFPLGSPRKSIAPNKDDKYLTKFRIERYKPRKIEVHYKCETPLIRDDMNIARFRHCFLENRACQNRKYQAPNILKAQEIKNEAV